MKPPHKSRWTVTAPPISENWKYSEWAYHSRSTLEDDGSGLGSYLLFVPWEAPITIRHGIECCAYYFRREFSYDFVQYAVREPRGDKRDCAFAWVSIYEPVMLGAGCFRWRTWTNAEPGPSMQWVWLHPFARRHGILQSSWPIFKKRFGDFFVESPLSPAMVKFLTKNKALHQAGVQPSPLLFG